MLNAISRYGARILPNTRQIIETCRQRGELVRGPQIEEFERAFAQRLGRGKAVSASYGRMAFLYILQGLGLPPGSEVIFPALTFWVVPEMARVAGLRPVFADVDPETFNLRPEAVERAITERTGAVVPTHLYGLPCDMDAILSIAHKHNLVVIEDCAHALGATYRGRPVGTLGDAAFFSFQMLKPLNTYGGGMAVIQDDRLARRVQERAVAERWPSDKEIMRQMEWGRVQRTLIRPRVFTFTAFPILWTASWTASRADVYLWESIRPLTPLPASYDRRYTNVQAALGLAGLAQLDAWTEATRQHAHFLDQALSGLPDVRTPTVPPDRTHVYYQYCIYAADRDELVRRCLRRGVDLETLHVDVCTDLSLFEASSEEMRGASDAARAVQLPVYASLSAQDLKRVAESVRNAAGRLRPATNQEVPVR